MSTDLIVLSLPAKPEYVMVTRLTSAAVATRVGFDVDQIEDIKMAVAEALILIINQQTRPGELSIKFTFEPNALNVRVEGVGNWEDNDISTHDVGQAHLSKYILGSMMDRVDFKADNNTIHAICMHKDVGG